MPATSERGAFWVWPCAAQAESRSVEVNAAINLNDIDASPRFAFVEIFDDAAFHFQRVERPLLFVEDLAGRIDQNGERQSAIPTRLKSLDQFVLVRIAEEQVLIRSLMLLQKGERFFFLVREVRRHRDEFKIALPVHAIDHHKIR